MLLNKLVPVQVTLFISEWYIHWIVSDKHSTTQDISSVNIKHAEFVADTFVTLHVVISLDDCPFSSFELYVYRSQYEPKPTEETIRAFHSNTTTHDRITISRSLLFKWMSKFSFVIFVVDIVREIKIVQCDVNNGYLEINIGNETSTQCDSFTLAKVVVENSAISLLGIYIYAHRPTSFGLIQFIDIDFQSSWVYNFQSGGSVGFYFDNCAFRDINNWGIHLPEVVHIITRNCQFWLKDNATCPETAGCSFNLKGFFHFYNAEPENFELATFLFFPTCTWQILGWRYCSSAYVENSELSVCRKCRYCWRGNWL